MMKSITRKQGFLLALGALALVMCFQNCSGGFGVQEVAQKTEKASKVDLCADDMLAAFKASYYPFLNQTCKNCHVSGPGKGAFAHLDASVAFSAFKIATTLKINTNAQTTSHASGATGPQNAEVIKEASETWEQALVDCNVAPPAVEAPRTLPKSNALTANFQVLSWNLSTELETGRGDFGGAMFSIEARAYTKPGGPTMYQFRNPRLAVGTKAIHIKSIHIRLNGVDQTLATTYSRVDVSMLPGAPAANLATGTLNLDQTVTTGDQLAVVFSTLETQ